MENYDLGKLADDLERQARHTRLTQAIRAALTVASAKADLDRVSGNLALIERLQVPGAMPEALSNEEAGTIIESLFTYAIIAYARATEIQAATNPQTKMPTRGQWFGVGRLPKEKRQIHRSVLHLRNKEMAHFGKGYLIDGEPLLEEVLFLRTGSTSPVNFNARRWAAKPAFVSGFVELAKSAQEQAGAKMAIAFTEVITLIHDIRSFDHSFDKLVAANLYLSELPASSIEGLIPGVVKSTLTTKVVQQNAGTSN